MNSNEIWTFDILRQWSVLSIFSCIYTYFVADFAPEYQLIVFPITGNINDGTISLEAQDVENQAVLHRYQIVFGTNPMNGLNYIEIGASIDRDVSFYPKQQQQQNNNNNNNNMFHPAQRFALQLSSTAFYGHFF